MKRSIDETLEETRQFFLDRARVAGDPGVREISEHLRELAEVVQENSRMLDVLRRKLEEVQHVLGVR